MAGVEFIIVDILMRPNVNGGALTLDACTTVECGQRV